MYTSGAVTGLDMLVELRKAGDPVDVIVITAANDKESVQTALSLWSNRLFNKTIYSFERFQ